MRTHYDLMNVSEGALDEVIRAAYRVLARRYHPDRNGNSSSSVERMQALNEAYDVLTDPVRACARRASTPNSSPGGRPRRTSTA